MDKKCFQINLKDKTYCIDRYKKQTRKLQLMVMQQTDRQFVKMEEKQNQ